MSAREKPDSAAVRLHPLLERQLRRHVSGELPIAWEAFVGAVDEAYRQSDIDREMLERAMELSSAELLEANSALRERAVELARSNSELEQFAYIASHDLQEPLRTITMYMQLLERRYGDKLDGKAQEFIGHAVASADVMHQLIRDLLSFARITSRAQPMAPTCMKDVIHEAMAGLETAIADADATVDISDMPLVFVDRTQIRQLWQNLISNAIKFRRAEVSPRVEVRARRDGADWSFAVADNGIGIAPKYTGRVFEIFQRLHTSDVYAGTGIGLAMCKKIVERHGGRIWLDSSPGEGSTFCFTLLAAPDPE